MCEYDRANTVLSQNPTSLRESKCHSVFKPNAILYPAINSLRLILYDFLLFGRKWI